MNTSHHFTKEDMRKIFKEEPDKRTPEQIKIVEEIIAWAESRKARDQRANAKTWQPQKPKK